MGYTPFVQAGRLNITTTFIGVFSLLIATCAMAQQGESSLEESNARRRFIGRGLNDQGRANLSATPPTQGGNTDLFFPVTAYDSGGGLAPSMVLADVNRDHTADIIIAHYGVESNGDSTVGVVIRNIDGTLRPVVAYDTGAANSGSVAVGDVNGDGKLDLVLGNSGTSNSVSVLLGLGDGTFAPAVVYSTGTSYDNWNMRVFITDLDGDGKGDVVALTQFSFAVLMGKADGTLKPAMNFFSEDGPLTSLALADLNHDGNLDAVTLTCGEQCFDNEAYLWLGNGDGDLRPSQPH